MNTCKDSNRHLMQGDQYDIPIEISTSDGLATEDNFLDVEVQLGNIRKTLSDGEIRYNPEKKAFLFPLRQEETFRLKKSQVEVQVRVKLSSGEIVGTSAGFYDIIDALSKTKI